MGGFSSKPTAPPKPQVTEIDRAMLDLKNSRDRLQRYRKKLEQDDAKILAQAQKAKKAGQTQTALGLLRLRKFKQAQATSCEDQLLNILQMVETIDSKQNEKQILEAMAAGKDTLKKMHEETTVEHVLELMDQIAEEHALEQEVSEILQGVPTLSAADEEAVEAELAAMQAEMDAEKAGTELPEVPNQPILPKVPDKPIEESTKIQEAVKEERVAVPAS